MMGHRANIYVHAGNDRGVYLYTHSDGFKLPEVLRTALSREERWNDDQYLARIVFCEMVRDDIDGSTNYGISTYLGDGENQMLDVDTHHGTVTWNEQVMWFREYIKEPRSW